MLVCINKTERDAFSNIGFTSFWYTLQTSLPNFQCKQPFHLAFVSAISDLAV